MSRIVVVSIICTGCFALRALLLLSNASLPNSTALIYFFFAEVGRSWWKGGGVDRPLIHTGLCLAFFFLPVYLFVSHNSRAATIPPGGANRLHAVRLSSEGV